MRPRNAARVLFLVLASLVGLGARAAEPVNLSPTWKVGDRVELDWVRQTSAVSPLTGEAFPALSQRVTISLIERTPDQLVLAWHYGPFSIAGMPRPAAGTIDPMLAALEDLTLEIQLNNALEVLGVRNADAVLARFDELSKKSAATSPPPRDGAADEQVNQRLNEAISNAKAFAETMRQNRQVMVNSLLQDAAFYVVGLGWKLEPGHETVLERETPNPFGGQPLVCTWHLALIDFKADQPTATVRWEQKFDPDKLRAVIKDALARAAKQSGLQARDTDVKVEQSEVATYTIERSSGWSVEGHYTKVRTIDGRTSSTEYRWRRAAPEAAPDRAK